MTQLFSKTRSPCPVCKKIVSADIVEKDKAMFMEKQCPVDGSFESKIAKYAWYYKGLNSFYNNLYPEDFYERRHPLFYTSEISQKCNLNCAVCFAGFSKSKRPEREDIRLEIFKKHLEKIKNKGTWIHLSGGGEPTLREDLPEIIRLISESGNAAGLATNGVLIAKDFNYLKKLKNSGLKKVYIWVDTLNNEEICRKIRNGNFIEIKRKALENLKKLKIPTQVFQVVIKGVNEGEIGEIMEFVRKNNFINTFWIRSYSYLGGSAFSPDQEFMEDEFVETIAGQSRGLFTLEDFYFFQKILIALSALQNLPHCYSAQSIYIPRNNEESMSETYRFEKFSKVLDEFEKRWQENKKKAKRYFYSKYFPRLLSNPLLAYFVFKKRVSRFGLGAMRPKHYCHVLINGTRLSDCDVIRVRQQCVNNSFNLGPENNIPRCLELITSYSPSKNDNPPRL